MRSAGRGGVWGSGESLQARLLLVVSCHGTPLIKAPVEGMALGQWVCVQGQMDEYVAVFRLVLPQGAMPPKWGLGRPGAVRVEHIHL